MAQAADEIARLRARCEKMARFIERLANQPLTDELEDHEKETADYEGAYEYPIKEARDFTKKMNEGGAGDAL